MTLYNGLRRFRIPRGNLRCEEGRGEAEGRKEPVRWSAILDSLPGRSPTFLVEVAKEYFKMQDGSGYSLRIWDLRNV